MWGQDEEKKSEEFNKNGDLKQIGLFGNFLTATFTNLKKRKSLKLIDDYSVLFYGIEADPKVCLQNVFGQNFFFLSDNLIG